MTRTRAIWTGLGFVFGSLLLLGFVLPPDSSGTPHRPADIAAEEDFPAASEQPEHYTCSDGVEREMRITVIGSQFTAVGELVSMSDAGVWVRAVPGQLFLELPAAGEMPGLLAGDAVTATGYIARDGSYQAADIAPACGTVAVTEVTSVPTTPPLTTPIVVAPVFASDEQTGPARSPSPQTPELPGDENRSDDDDKHDKHDKDDKRDDRDDDDDYDDD